MKGSIYLGERKFPFCFGGNDSTVYLIHNILITGLGWSLKKTWAGIGDQEAERPKLK